LSGRYSKLITPNKIAIPNVVSRFEEIKILQILLYQLYFV